MSDDLTVRLGQELVKRKLATLTQVRDGVATREEFERSGTRTTLGNILVSKGVVGLEQLKEVLSELGELFLGCPQCNTVIRIDEYERSNEYLCKQCKGELVYVSNPPRSSTTRSRSTTGQGSRRRPDPERRREEEENLVGRRIGGCLIRKRLAAGGMGTVYEAEQVNLGRKIALKILATDLAEDEVFVRRFLLEARAAAELNHPNLIHINDAGDDEGLFYYTMEFIEGENLAQLLKREKMLPFDRALAIIGQAAAGLGHAHEKGIIHRDIKPENIMLNHEGNVKIADLGLAKKTFDETASAITHTGSILGTPHYMAPEQARDLRLADQRSDIYSLGVTLYRMICGQVPFNGNSPIEVMMKAVEGNKAPVSELRSDAPTELQALIDRMMHVDPSRRFASTASLSEAIATVRKKLLERA